MISIREGTPADAAAIRYIAYSTWPIAYGEILSSTQLNYMLEKLYSIEELEQQLAGNTSYLIAEDDFQNSIGFASFSLLKDTANAFHLQKLYILPGFQRHQCGTMLLEVVIKTVKELKGQRLTLNVNRFNKARFFYEKSGFSIIREEDIDIGNGYFMNDFVMEMKLD